MSNPTHIELCGLPGAGKTAVSKELRPLLSLPEKYGLLRALSRADGTPKYMRRLLHLPHRIVKATRGYDAWAFESIARNPSLQVALVPHVRALGNWAWQPTSDVRHLALVQRSLERDLVLALQARHLGFGHVNDDGVAQRLVSLLAMRSTDCRGETSKALVRTVIESLPKSAVIVAIDIEADTAHRRVQLRKSGPPRLLTSEHWERGQKNINDVLNQLETHALAAGVSFLRVHGTDSPISTARHVEHVLKRQS